jgi:hypothetical protein
MKIQKTKNQNQLTTYFYHFLKELIGFLLKDFRMKNLIFLDFGSFSFNAFIISSYISGAFCLLNGHIILSPAKYYSRL